MCLHLEKRGGPFLALKQKVGRNTKSSLVFMDIFESRSPPSFPVLSEKLV